MVNNLSTVNSIANRFLAELRDAVVQADRMRFRRNLERIGEVLAYEISKTLDYELRNVETPLGIAEMNMPQDKIVLSTILRAGLPLHQGFLNYFDWADNAFVASYRAQHKDGTFEVNTEYVSCPPLEDKILILSDPMLATGTSLVKAAEELLRTGTPKKLHIATVLATTDGIRYVRRNIPKATIWTAAIDEELTARSYIVPGLGDAGDLAFGEKIQGE